jgi:RNA polymerase sigma-70 factor, ECF subfamily
MDPDLALLERWRAGDKRAGEELFARYFAPVFRFFDGKIGARAEDLTQQTFLTCLKTQDRFRAQSSFRTYLFGIVWNELRHFLRREAKLEHIDFDQSSLSELSALITSPTSGIDRDREKRRLHQALVQLPVAQQILLEYHYWHDLDAGSLGQLFGVPPGTIRTRLTRARQALRERIADTGDAGAREDDGDPMTSSLVTSEADDKQSPNTGTASR